MPRELYDSEGNSVQVPDETELTAQQQKVETYEKEKAAWDTDRKRLEEEANPDFRALRREKAELEKRAKQYEEELKAAGVKTQIDKAFSREEIEQIAEEKARKMTFEQVMSQRMEGMDEQKRNLFLHHYQNFNGTHEEKLTVAETMTGRREKRSAPTFRGAPPAARSNEDISPETQEMAQALGNSREDFKGGVVPSIFNQDNSW